MGKEAASVKVRKENRKVKIAVVCFTNSDFLSLHFTSPYAILHLKKIIYDSVFSLVFLARETSRQGIYLGIQEVRRNMEKRIIYAAFYNFILTTLFL